MRVPAPTLAVSALTILALLSLRCGDGGGSSAPDGTNVGPTATASTPPEEALRLYVQRRLGQGFVQECEDARRPDDVGKQCARYRGERNGLLAYELGPTFSEYTRLIILERAGGSWTIAHLENRDPSLPDVPGIPWPLEVGITAVVAGTGDCLRVRSQPGTGSPQVDCIDDGETVTIVAGPVELDDLEWWQLEGYGWAAGAWLRYPDEAADATAEP
jgi:hypothetical protein